MKKLFYSLALALPAFLGSACSENTAKTECNAAADNTQAVIENIMTRASVRNFTGEAIGSDTLETILKAGMAAPTAMNKQPWAFVVVTERAALDSLAAVHKMAHLEKAGAAVVVCADMNRSIEGEGRAFWIQDCSAATENILLAVHAYGLGAVWCGVHPIADRVAGVRAALDMPDYIIPLNIVTIGHPEGTTEPKDKWNPDNVHYQKW